MNRICTTCLMDDSDKEIKFDSNGECNYCKIYPNFVTDTQPGSVNTIEKLCISILMFAIRLNNFLICLIISLFN